MTLLDKSPASDIKHHYRTQILNSTRKALKTLSLRRLRGRDAFRFLSLPAEIRDEIYRHYFGPGGIHIVNNEGKVASFRCKRTDKFRTADCCTEMSYMSSPFEYKGSRGDDRPVKIDTAIFYVCKQVSQEARAALYRTATFQACSFAAWLSFAASIPPSYLAMIKSLCAFWVSLPCLTMAPVLPDDSKYPEYEYYTAFMDGHFEEFWDVLATRMPGLRNLAFKMDYTGGYLSRAVKADWHRQLTKVTGLKQFDLEIFDTFDRDGEKEMVKEQMRVLKQYLRERMCSRIAGFELKGQTTSSSEM